MRSNLGRFFPSGYAPPPSPPLMGIGEQSVIAVL